MRYDKMDRFIKIHNKIKYLVLFDDCCDEICNRIKVIGFKKVVLQVVLIIILQKSELIHIILYLLKKY